MSGGYFEYRDRSLKDEMFHYNNQPWNVMEDMELSLLIWDVLELIHTFDYYKSDDTSKDTYLEEKNAFKKKWIRNTNYRKDVLYKIIEDEFEAKKKELLEMVGLEEELT